MKIIKFEGFKLSKSEILKIMRSGDIFIYPTDTIYGVGCDATNSDSVSLIRRIKNRDEKPFSVIAPSKDWILENCIVDEKCKKWLDKLPGPYTLVLNLKNRKCIAGECNNFGDSLGVRIPDHWIKDFVSELGRPIVTTSVNVSGMKNMFSLNDIDESVESRIDFCLYEGEKDGNASTVVILTGDKEKVIER